MSATTRIRERRTGWAAGVRVRLTKRDLDILYLLGRCGVLRTRDIAMFAFGSRVTARDRLRILSCAGLVSSHVRALDEDNYFTLTAAGRAALVEAFGDDGLEPDDLRVLRELPAKLDHLVLINIYRIAVARACTQAGAYNIVSFETDSDLARDRNSTLLDLIPDARVEIEHVATGRRVAYFLEADRGTESCVYVARKIKTYGQYDLTRTPFYGVVSPFVVVVAPSLRRARNLARAVTAATSFTRVVYTLPEFVQPQTVLGGSYATEGHLLAEPLSDDAASIFGQRLLP